MQFQFHKNARTLAVAILLTAVIFSLCACGPKLRYGTWKDTHEVYGDGEYQLMTDPDHSYSLYNNAISQTILSYVSPYKNVGKTAYFYGESPISREERVRLFAVLHTESNELCYVLDEASVPSDHRELLENYVGRRFSDIAVTVLDLSELSAEEQSIFLSLRENAEWDKEPSPVPHFLQLTKCLCEYLPFSERVFSWNLILTTFSVVSDGSLSHALCRLTKHPRVV